MKRKVIEFYRHLGLELSIMTSPAKRPLGVTTEEIEVAAIDFYNLADIRGTTKEPPGFIKMKSGENVKVLTVVRRIHRLINENKAKEYADYWKTMRNIKSVLDAREIEYRRLCVYTLFLIAAIATDIISRFF